MFCNIQFLHALNTVNKVIKNNKKSTFLLLVAEKSQFDTNLLDHDINIFGAVFPRLIFKDQSYDEGYILIQISKNTSIFILEDMEQTIDIVEIDKFNSFMLLVDGLSSKINFFLEAFFELVNENAKIIGGGAGKLTLEQEPVIFSNKYNYQDAALVIASSDLISVGVKHGWEEIAGPFIVTNSKNCHLNEINYETAFEFYKEVVEKDSGKFFNNENFFDIAKGYPIGVSKVNCELIVRDPITTDGKSLTLVGEIEDNSVIYVLKGVSENLFTAAHEATDKALKCFSQKKVKQIVVIDCISRFLFLDKNFTNELYSINKNLNKNISSWGILSLGEIANTNEENIDFYNKTCVIGAL